MTNIVALTSREFFRLCSDLKPEFALWLGENGIEMPWVEDNGIYTPTDDWRILACFKDEASAIAFKLRWL